MADGSTPNYDLILAEVGASPDTWGTKINRNFSDIDSIMHDFANGILSAGSSYLPLSGGTMTGPLNLSRDPTAALEAVPLRYMQQYVQQQIQSAVGTGGQYLPLTGGTISGNLTVNGQVSVGGNITATGSGSSITAVTVVGTLNLDSRGAVYIASTATSHNFQMGGSATDRALYWHQPNNSDVYNVTGNSRRFNLTPAGGVVSPQMVIDGTGNIAITGAGFKPGGGSWLAVSDDRVKRDVSDYNTGLDAILRLRPIRFRYNGQGDTNEHDERYYVGLSAQSTQSVMPEVVLPDVRPLSDKPGARHLPGQLATDLTALPMALVNAIQELAQRVEELEANAT